jgi:peptidylamidoglycolate lyase
MEFGDMSGADVDREGHVMLVHRGSASDVPEGGRIPEPVVVTLDSETGEVLQSWGSDTFLNPHGLTVDHEDNVWITDTRLHQVFKFTHGGELLLTLGEAEVPGWDEEHFNQPTQVAVLPDGSFYVGDGYVNSRVAKFDSEGNFLFEWGEAGDQPGQFDNPHGITVGPDGNLLVSDRENSRVQIFDLDGKFITEWLGARATGRVFSASVGPDGFIYLAIRPGGRDPLRTGVLKLDRNLEIVAQIGFKDTGDAVFQAAHYAAIGLDGAVYLAETPDRRISKYVPVR